MVWIIPDHYKHIRVVAGKLSMKVIWKALKTRRVGLNALSKNRKSFFLTFRRFKTKNTPKVA